MSLISSKIHLRKNGLIRLNNSNKNIFMKKYFTKKIDDSNAQNEITEKSVIKINNFITNTSVKKIKQVKKISINDPMNKNKCSLKKSQNSNSKNNKSLLIKKNTSIQMKKLDYENKENQRINIKEKMDNKRIIKKSLKISVNDAKLTIKQNLPKLKKSIKTQIFNKNSNKGNILSKLLINTENDSDKEKNNKNESKRNSINLKKTYETKEISSNKINKTLIASHETKNLIENGKTDEQEDELEENKIIEISQDEDIEYIFRYDRNKILEKKHHFKTNICPNRTKPFIKISKDNVKHCLNKNTEKPQINIVHRKINTYLFNKSDIKLYKSINNNEKENGTSFIDLINNFDIINIISKKEKYKQLSKSIHSKSILNNTKEISEESCIKKFPTLKKKFQLNGLNIIYNSSNESIEEKEKERKKKEIYIAKTVRNNNPISKSISILNSKKNYHYSKINKTIAGNETNNTNDVNAIQNKWNKKYFIPIVSASLIKGEEKKGNDINKDKYILNDNDNKENMDKIEKNFEFNNYSTNPKKHVNFGDNNKKKREILFNFTKIKNENNKYLSFRTNRTNSFINKRNMHITERNNSIKNIMNQSHKYYLNRDVDLDVQEKKLKLICKEITKYKFRKRFHNLQNVFPLSLDKSSDKNINNNNNNKKEEKEKEEEIKNENNYKNKIIQSHKVNKKYKTFLIKINPLNIINDENNNFANGNKLVIKRGDLLNRLRKMKQNYNKLEVNNIN